MFSRRSLLVITLCIGIGGAGIFWFFSTFERKEVEVLGRPSPGAQRNLYLAAERLLRFVGTDAESVKGLDLLVDLPPVEDAVFVPPYSCRTLTCGDRWAVGLGLSGGTSSDGPGSQRK